jgi:hypothetical protein
MSGHPNDRENSQHQRPESGGQSWNPEMIWRCDIH